MEKGEICDAIRDFLDGHDYQYEYHADTQNIVSGFSVDCKLRNVQTWWDILDDAFLLYGISPISASPDNLGEVLKYVAMINYGLIPANFEVDVGDGEIRSKIWIPLAETETVSEESIQGALSFTLTLFERFGDGFAVLAMGFSDAETEFKKAMKAIAEEE